MGYRLIDSKDKRQKEAVLFIKQKMALVSKSALGGNNGKLLNGLSGCQMDMRLFFFLAEGMAARYVDAIDTSIERVEKKG